MRDEYDFSKAKRNPYAKALKRQVTININGDTIDYFKDMAGETGIPYQVLINLYLTDCAEAKRKLRLTWMPDSETAGK
ncbi:MAG: antitoxin [Lachnospiraceae bacterium]|nr:antitoxin [Lachnospiraceae bacterium]